MGQGSRRPISTGEGGRSETAIKQESSVPPKIMPSGGCCSSTTQTDFLQANGSRISEPRLFPSQGMAFLSNHSYGAKDREQESEEARIWAFARRRMSGWDEVRRRQGHLTRTWLTVHHQQLLQSTSRSSLIDSSHLYLEGWGSHELIVVFSTAKKLLLGTDLFKHLSSRSSICSSAVKLPPRNTSKSHPNLIDIGVLLAR